MQIAEHVPLANKTTLRLDGPARYFAAASSEADIPDNEFDMPRWALYAQPMELQVPPELETKLHRVAAAVGKKAERLAIELLTLAVEHDDWFHRAVERGRRSAREGRLLDHDEVASLIEKLSRLNRVRWTTSAADDLQQICDYIAESRPDAARRVAKTLVDGVAGLRKFPRRGRVGHVSGTRELVFGSLPFVAVYEFAPDDSVQVLRILHGARRWPPL